MRLKQLDYSMPECIKPITNKSLKNNKTYIKALISERK